MWSKLQQSGQQCGFRGPLSSLVLFSTTPTQHSSTCILKARLSLAQIPPTNKGARERCRRFRNLLILSSALIAPSTLGQIWKKETLSREKRRITYSPREFPLPSPARRVFGSLRFILTEAKSASPQSVERGFAEFIWVYTERSLPVSLRRVESLVLLMAAK